MNESVKNRRLLLILTVLLAVALIFGVSQWRRVKKLTYLQNIEYNRVFHELTGYVDDLEISLLKGQVVSSKEQMAKLSADLYQQSGAAKANLALLPVNGRTLSKTSEFLSQVGEYAACISDKMLKGEELKEEEISAMQDLLKYAGTLKNSLDNMLMEITEGKVSFDSEKNYKAGFLKSKSNVADGLEMLEEEFHNYPSLIYDGPFSQHLSLKQSAFLEGKAEISKKQAEKLAKKFIGRDKKVAVTEIGGNLPSFAVNSNSETVEFTKKGGILLLLIRDRVVTEETLTPEEAKVKAQEFLQKNGFFKMKESYYEKKDGSMVINYAYSQDGYTVFPDLVKVKVALDNGEIIGFESRGYVTNHTYRQIPLPKVTQERALFSVSDHIETEEVTLAIIPLESGGEAPCWQIKGIVVDKHFLMYVNTQTGYTEDVQILLESDNGVLAV